jgi:peptidoglycan/xylan/chitin deacetylase (PgdA/CDA1 family)
MFRLDRFISLYFFHPLAKRMPGSGVKVPILMYHSISHARRNGVHPYYETATSPAVFARQIGFLKENGYQVIGLEELPAVFSGHPNRGKKYVVITFDDGLLDFCVTANPILKKHAFSATVYLPAGLMGEKLAGQDVMCWKDARAMTAEGITFGSHSLTHPKLIELKLSALENEIRKSKDIIEVELGQEVNTFSYPYAFPEQDKPFVQCLRKLLTVCGYKTGVTTIIGISSSNDRNVFLKRVPINDYDDLQFFKAKLEGGYDWLHAGQRIFKRVQRLAAATKTTIMKRRRF